MNISSNAVGNYGIHIKFVLIIFDEIKEVLLPVFNFSLVRFKILSFKIKSPSECKEYRPTNILCVLGKNFKS